WWCLDDSTEKEEDVDKDENKVSNDDLKPDAPSCKMSLFEWFWDNVDCDDSIKKVESVEAKMINVVNIDLDEEGKTDMSELKVENLPESLDEEENRNDGVQALEYCQKFADKENVSKLFGEPKLEDVYRLVFDREKIIIISIDVVGLNEDVGKISIENDNLVIDDNDDLVKCGMKNNNNGDKAHDGNVREKHDEKRKYTYCCEYKFRDEASCHDEHLDCVYKSGVKIERNEKDRLDIRNRVDELEDNKVKGKEAKVKNDVEEVVITQVENDMQMIK
ncbi:15517_t:CDS:2, partial [Racocetra fulgida]